MSAEPPPGEDEMVPAAGAAPEGSDAATEAEVEALRQQVAGLQEKLDDAGRDGPHGFWQRVRSPIAVILIVIGSILAPLSVVTVFVRNQVLSTDRYVATVAPLGADPAIQSVVADQVTQQLFSRIDVKTQIEDVLPPRAAFLAGPLTSGLHALTLRAANKYTHSDRFEHTWTEINRAAHEQIVGVLTGKAEGAVSADRNGKVSLNLHTAAVRVQRRLVASGLTIFSRIPTDKVGGTITLFQSAQLVKAQRGARFLNSAAYLLPFLSLACYAGAIGVSRRRRRTTLQVGAALAAAMAVLAIALGTGRSYLISVAGHSLTPAAAAAFFDIMLRNVRIALRIILFVGLLVALIAWLAGPARPAAAFRHGVARAWHWIVDGVHGRRWRFGPAGSWMEDNRGWIQVGVVVVAFIILVFWTPGWAGSLLLVLIAGAAVLVLQGMGTGHGRLAAATSAGTGPGDGSPGPATVSGASSPGASAARGASSPGASEVGGASSPGASAAGDESPPSGTSGADAE